MPKPAYQRILLKLSSKSLMGKQKFGVDPDSCQKIAAEVFELCHPSSFSTCFPIMPLKKPFSVNPVGTLVEEEHP